MLSKVFIALFVFVFAFSLHAQTKTELSRGVYFSIHKDVPGPGAKPGDVVYAFLKRYSTSNELVSYDEDQMHPYCVNKDVMFLNASVGDSLVKYDCLTEWGTIEEDYCYKYSYVIAKILDKSKVDKIVLPKLLLQKNEVEKFLKTTKEIAISDSIGNYILRSDTSKGKSIKEGDKLKIEFKREENGQIRSLETTREVKKDDLLLHCKDGEKAKLISTFQSGSGNSRAEMYERPYEKISIMEFKIKVLP